MLDDVDSDEREGFLNESPQAGSRSPTDTSVKGRSNKSRSLPYPSLASAFTSSGPQAATESTDDDGLDDRAKALKKKNKLFRNFSKHAGKDGTKKKEKLFHKRKPSKNDEGFSSGIFGCPLSYATEKTRLSDGIPLPQIIRDCIDAVERNGLDLPGIYKTEVPKHKLESLRDQYDHFRMKPGSLASHDAMEVSELLKMFLVELPEPLFPTSFSNIEISDEKTGLSNLNKFLNKHQSDSRTLFIWMLSHFRNVLSKSKLNGLKCSDVVQILSTSLRIHSTQLLTTILSSQLLMSSLQVPNLKYPDALFNSFVEPSDSRLASDRVTGKAVGGAKLNNACGISPPDSPKSLKKDLQLYEDLLANLHTKMEDPLADKGVEEELWEVQRIVTSYKRKLRSLKCGPSEDRSSTTGSVDKDSVLSSKSNSSSDKLASAAPQSTETASVPASTTPNPSTHVEATGVGRGDVSGSLEEKEPTSIPDASTNGDAIIWREMLLSSELQMKEQLIVEITNMRRTIALLEAQRQDLLNKVSKEFAGAPFEFKMKNADTMSDEEKAELFKSQEDSEAIYRRMVEEVEAVCRKQADVTFLQWKLINLGVTSGRNIESQTVH